MRSSTYLLVLDLIIIISCWMLETVSIPEPHQHWNIDDWIVDNLQETSSSRQVARTAKLVAHPARHSSFRSNRFPSTSSHNHNGAHKVRLAFSQSRRNSASRSLKSNHTEHDELKPSNDANNTKIACDENCQVPMARESEEMSMMSSYDSIKSLFAELFPSIIRNHETNQDGYIHAKRLLRNKFKELGLSTLVQKFQAKTITYLRARTKATPRMRTHGHNIIGILPGTHRYSQPDKDEVVVIGAHMDSMPHSPGIDDNASGSVVMLELARLLQSHKCRLNTTIIFVLFDLEEYGLVGSRNFVRNYLLAREDPSKVKAAIIMDMMLGYDPRPNVQTPKPFNKLIPGFGELMRKNQYRGDFHGVWARNNVDTPFFETLQRNWKNAQKYKLHLMAPSMSTTGSELNRAYLRGQLKEYGVFLRSDHASFWYPDFHRNITFANTILLTDLGPWRKSIVSRYHTPKDNFDLLTDDNLNFLTNSIDSIFATLLDIGDGKCQSSFSSD